MNIKSIFAAILMFITNILSSVKDLYTSIFKEKVDISNSTTVPEIPMTDTEYIENLSTVPEISIADTANAINPTTIPEIPFTESSNILNQTTIPKIPFTDYSIPDITNILMCTKEKEISYTEYLAPCDSSFKFLVDALNSIGAQSDPSYRTTIAHLNGIENYEKTAEQNNLLLDKLKNGTLIKSIETKIETITFPCDNEADSNDIEIIPNITIEKIPTSTI